MPRESTNLKLKLYNAVIDAKELARDWFSNVFDYSNSNWVKIDDAYGAMQEEINNRPTNDTVEGYVKDIKSGTDKITITKGSGVQTDIPIKTTIDSTLSIRGQAADAKITGDKLNEKLDLSGGVMTGDINYKGKISTSPAISFINNGKNADGNGIKIGGGIDTIIGGGQSAQTVGKNITTGNKNLILASDDVIDIYTNCKDAANASNLNNATHKTINAKGVFTGAAKYNLFNYSSIRVDLSDSSYDQNTWYPVVGDAIPHYGLKRIACQTELNSGTKPSWSTHNKGFTAIVDLLVTGSYHGETSGKSMLLTKDFLFGDPNPPVGYTQMTYSSTPVFYLRGGGAYNLFSEYETKWSVKTSTYTAAGQSVQPTSTYPGIVFDSLVNIKANLDGKALYSTYAYNGVTSSNFTVSNSSTPLGSSGYIRFESGIQICWGTAPEGTDKVTVTLPMPFKNKNYIVTIGAYADIQHGYAVSSTTQTTTTFQMIQNGVTNLRYAAYAAFGLWR